MSTLFDQRFIDYLTNAFGEQICEAVIVAYDDEPVRLLRHQARRISATSFATQTGKISRPSELLPEERILTDLTFHFGSSWLQHSGVCYAQDPSAAMVVQAMDILPTDQVIDLCAAPGGKSTAILNKLNTDGFLWCNEVDQRRALVLKENLERWGDDGYGISVQPVDRLASALPEVFDQVLLDAPCSAEALYRRLPETRKQYHPDHQIRMSVLQLDLLNNAYQLTRPGGKITYATCTLNLTENEMVVSAFLRQHPDCTLRKTHLPFAQPGYLGLGDRVARYFPGSLGEGQFIAVIQKGGFASPRKSLHVRSSDNIEQRIVTDAFVMQEGSIFVREHLITQTMHTAMNHPLLQQIGTPVAVRKGKVLIPHHALSHRVDAPYWLSADTALDQADLMAYLNGQTIQTTKVGWQRVCWRGNAIGLGKGRDGMLHNHYPKGLRNLQCYRFEETALMR